MGEVNSFSELVKKCEEKIDGPLIKNKPTFYLEGSKGKLGKIREILDFGTPKLNQAEKKAFKEICKGRIDKLESLITAHITFVSISLVTLTIAFSVINEAELIPTKGKFPGLQWIFWGEGWWGMRILLFLILFFVIIFAISVFRCRAQAYAWYAVREGVLLMEGKEDGTGT